MSREGTVLIVEDERELANMYKNWLSDRYTVHVAYTADEAINNVSHDIDVALLDRRLPDQPGGVVLDEIRERRPGCRVAMLTAVDPDFDILEMPFDDYVVKPVLKSELLDLVNRLMNLATYDDKLQTSYRLASKLHALESEKTKSELEANPDYAETESRLHQLHDEIDETLPDLTDREFMNLYVELETPDEDPEPKNK